MSVDGGCERDVDHVVLIIIEGYTAWGALKLC